MINFKAFLIEAVEPAPKGKALKHLTHVEDNVLYGGHEGVALADNHLRGIHDMLMGRKSGVTASTKYDGAPSIVFGQHPKTGQFFVATKGAFNKTPKIAYTHEDIDQHYGHAPGLAAKMHEALDHLPKIIPREGGVYQSDIIHTTGDVKSEKGMSSVTPNTITYSAPNGSAEATNMRRKLGIVVHTHYKGRGDIQDMNAAPLDAKQRAKFGDHPDVNNIDPTINVNPSNYTQEEQDQFHGHMENARQTYAKMKPEAMDALAGHGGDLEAHVNDQIRKSGAPSVQGYKDFLTARHQKNIAKLKTQKAIDAKNQEHDALLQHITENQDHFQKALELHQHLQNAKNVLVGVMAKNNPYSHSVGGVATDPEGAVIADRQGNMSKFVNRQEFSRLNFLKGQFQKASANADV
jgi:hypothetical protein